MLELMRKHARNWMMKVLLGIIIIVFIFYFGSMGGQQKAETVATIHGKALSYAEIQREYERLVDYHRQRYGAAMTEEVFKSLNLKQQALDGLVKQAIVLAKAGELRLQVTDEEVRASILATPAFQTNGAFDDRLYRSMLRYNKVTPEEFEDGQRKVLTMARLEYLIQDGVKVAAEEVETLYRYQGEKIALQYAVLPASAYREKVAPSVPDLEKYLKDHGEEFRVPEQFQIRYLAFLGEDHAADVVVGEEEAKEAYDRNKGSYAKDGKTIPFAEVRQRIIGERKQAGGMQRAQAEAKKAHDTIYQEENFDAYAAKKGLKVRTVDYRASDKIPAEMEGVPDLVKVLGGLEKDMISRVLSGAKGYFVVRVSARKPAYVPSLKDVEAEVKKRYVESESRNLARRDAESLLETLRKGEPFAKAVAGKGLKIQETGLVSVGAPIPGLGASAEMREALNILSDRKPYPEKPFPAEGGIAVIRFKERIFDEKGTPVKKEDLAQALLSMKRSDAVQTWIEGVKEAMQRDGRLTYAKDVKDL